MSRGARFGTLAALLLAVLASSAVPAFADGDPASDYLLSQSTFLSPFDGHIPACPVAGARRDAREREAAGLFAEGGGDRDELRPRAPCRSSFDKPQTYAKFLAEEDFYYWKDELLVVMPNGYGIYKGKALPAADAADDPPASACELDERRRVLVQAAETGRAGARRAPRAHPLDRGGRRAARRRRLPSGSRSLRAPRSLVLLLGFGARLAWRRMQG